LGSAAAGTAGAAGQTAAQLAAQQALTGMGSATAQELALQAAQQAALEGTKQAAPSMWGAAKEGLLGAGNSFKSGLSSMGDKASGLLYQGAVPGVGPQQAQMLAEQTSAFGADGLAKTMQAAASNPNLNAMQRMMGEYGGRAVSGLLGSKGGSAQGSQMAMKMGAGLLDGGQQPQAPMAPPPRQQVPQEPLSMPYQNRGGPNSMDLPPPGMTMQEWLRRKQMMGRM
jgi:hypothetical protein